MGCDLWRTSKCKSADSFNPRTRMGCDTSCRKMPTSVRSFNPRTRMGCDTAEPATAKSNIMFQSTHPHGVRRARQRTAAPMRSFNPRTRMGCDINQSLNSVKHRVSIHAPAWGATNLKHPVVNWSNVSIHAPAWGATNHFLT